MSKRIQKQGNYWYCDFQYKGKRFRNKLHTDETYSQLLVQQILAKYELELAGITDQVFPIDGDKFDQVVADPDPEPEPKPKPKPKSKGISMVEAVNKFIKQFYKIDGAYHKVFGRSGYSQAQSVTSCLKKYHQHSGIDTVDQANFDNLSGFMAYRQETMNNNTMAKQRAFINKFFDYAENKGWINKSPARALPKYKLI